jgi:hypothetical protein
MPVVADRFHIPQPEPGPEDVRCYPGGAALTVDSVTLFPLLSDGKVVLTI